MRKIKTYLIVAYLVVVFNIYWILKYTPYSFDLVVGLLLLPDLGRSLHLRLEAGDVAVEDGDLLTWAVLIAPIDPWGEDEGTPYLQTLDGPFSAGGLAGRPEYP